MSARWPAGGRQPHTDNTRPAQPGPAYRQAEDTRWALVLPDLRLRNKTALAQYLGV